MLSAMTLARLLAAGLLLYRLLRPLLFLLDAELAHSLVALFLRLWSRLFPRPRARPVLAQKLWGLDFPGPVGLAAGMDKGEVLAPAWFRLGFGFVEIGTVTPRPQPGNPRPRLFRLKDQRALVNRMGFNNAGAEEVARRLRALPRQPGPVFVNIGRNKDTPNERAAEDYVAALKTLAPHADGVVINVSSPNTPGLRELQENLGALVKAVVQARSPERNIPVLVKLSPDEERLEEIAEAAVAAGADGIVATNTTVDHQSQESGGLSGEPLRAKALAACARIYRKVGGKVPIIGVGGIATAEDAYARIRAGASLVEIYTALVYQGPLAPREISEGLAALLARDGLTLAQAVGRDA
jgi:dihydroorotate dehydrogenase